MIGLALQGGGTRGAYQAGAALAFKRVGIKFNGICGTSIGAFNGAMILCGKEKELIQFWENADMAQVLGFDEKFIEKRLKKEHDFQYLQLKFKNIVKILTKRGFDIHGLENVLKTYLKEEDIRNSKIDFGLCTIRLKGLKPLYIFKESMKEGKLNEYILASCYLPIFKMEKKVDEQYYLDGGFYDSAPLNMLIDKGYKKIYVVELNPILNIQKKPKTGAEIIRICPKRSLGFILNFDAENMKEFIKMGYYDTLRVIKKLDGYYYCFKNYPNIFYRWLIRKVPFQLKDYIQGFFRAKSEKEMVIKSLEYIMKNEEMDYYQVYQPIKMIHFIKKNYQKNHLVYNFIRKI